MMIIKQQIDIEDEIRQALTNDLDVFVRPLPEKFKTPCILITKAGGTTENEVDTFTVRIDARGKTDAEADEYLRLALGVLEYRAKQQTGALRGITINALSSWGNDPARPDIKLCTATVLVTAHSKTKTII